MILVAEHDCEAGCVCPDDTPHCTYQIIGEVVSDKEARELMANYLEAGPDADWMPVHRFVLISRDETGGYTQREEIEL